MTKNSQHTQAAPPTIDQALSRFVVDAAYENISVQARQQIKAHILDAVGCAIAALDAPPIRALKAQIDEFGGKPLVSLLGGGKSAPDRAAFYNSAAERYLDFMDSYVAKHETCHPADNIMSVLAACEYARASGKDFITATAVAYQVQCRLSAEAPVRPKDFDHTVQGAYACAAGVAKALDLPDIQVANAIAMSGASYNGLRVTRSGNLSNWKGLAYPNMAFGATSVAFLAKRGVTGPLGVFEGKGGLMDAITGKFKIGWAKEDLEMVLKTNIKKYNAEFHAQTAMEAVLDIRQNKELVVADIKAIDVDIFDVAYNIIGGGNDGDKQHVKTKEEADHSLPYMLAVALLDGEVTPKQYLAERILKPDVQELLKKVTIRPKKSLSDQFPEAMPCKIEIELKNGKKMHVEKHDYEGFYSRPMSWEKVVAKFDALTAAYVSSARRAAIVEVINTLEKKEAIELTALFDLVGKKETVAA
jgi:2-methylcitrate dehydratase